MADKTRRQIIILGAGVMQGPVISIAGEMGLETVVVDGDSAAVNARRADRFEHIDLKDKEGVEALARSLQKEGRLGGIITAGTDFSTTVAWVAERLGLPGIPYETALNASDKGRMRRRFREAGVPSPPFIVLSSQASGAEDGFAGGLPFNYPVVVKPVDNMGARGCRRVDSPAELAAALPPAFAFSRSGAVIVEAFMEGPEFSVDALVYHGEIAICGLADRHIFFPPYFIEMGHTMPAGIDDDAAGRLIETFTAGVRALGLLDGAAAGAAKGDIKLTPSGPMIGEIAARLSGGYMSGWTYPYASGVEVTRGAIMAALGEKPRGLLPLRAWTAAERAFISIPGRVRSVIALRAAKAAPYVKDVFLRATPGTLVSFPENNVSKCGNIIAMAPARAAAIAAAESAARMVLLPLVVPYAETAAFLAAFPEGDAGWPPSAYTVPPEIFALLAAIPDPAPPSSCTEKEIVLAPFPALAGSDLRDWMGRTVAESLDAVREITGRSLPGASSGVTDGEAALGRRFWAALIRGGYQGAAYVTECFAAGLAGIASTAGIAGTAGGAGLAGGGADGSPGGGT